MRHQVVHNRGHGFPKDLSLQGCTTLPTRANRLLIPLQLCPLPLEADRGWMATLYSCANLSMIHQVTATSHFLREARIAAPSHSPTLSPQGSRCHASRAFSNTSSNSHPNGNSRTRGPMDRCAHASSFVRIAHTLQRVVCTLSLGSKSRTTVLGSARQN